MPAPKVVEPGGTLSPTTSHWGAFHVRADADGGLGSYGWASAGRFHHAQSQHQAVEPDGEARDDYAILAGLAERLGFAEAFTESRTPREWLVHLYDGWREGLRVQGLAVPTFEEFWHAGSSELPAGPSHFTLFEEFRADPDRNPLRTPSGRIGIVSDTVRGFGYADCPGHPVWLEPDEWPGAERADRFPLVLIANQPSTRPHSQLDVGPVSQASKIADREAVRLHPADTARRGIADGDVVRVFNDHGACLAGAVLTADVRPGVAQPPTGAWFDPVPGHEDVPLCAHGNPNVLTADVPSSRLSQGCTGQHALVEIERLAGDPPPVTVTGPPALLRKEEP